MPQSDRSYVDGRRRPGTPQRPNAVAGRSVGFVVGGRSVRIGTRPRRTGHIAGFVAGVRSPDQVAEIENRRHVSGAVHFAAVVAGAGAADQMAQKVSRASRRTGGQTQRGAPESAKAAQDGPAARSKTVAVSACRYCGRRLQLKIIKCTAFCFPCPFRTCTL